MYVFFCLFFFYHHAYQTREGWNDGCKNTRERDDAESMRWSMMLIWQHCRLGLRVAATRVFNFCYFFNFAKHETIRKPGLFRENFACFAKQNYAKFRFVSFHTTKIEVKFRFVLQKFSFVCENFILFRIEREIFCRNSRKSRTTF
jgi:hypothetical protein